jgi:hypothetical protein
MQVLGCAFPRIRLISEFSRSLTRFGILPRRPQPFSQVAEAKVLFLLTAADGPQKIRVHPSPRN